MRALFKHAEAPVGEETRLMHAKGKVGFGLGLARTWHG